MKGKGLRPLNKGIEIAHCLPHRIRLRFEEPLASLQLECIQLYIQQLTLPVLVRPVGHGQGLVLESLDPQKRITTPEILALVELAANAGPVHTASPPPTAEQIRRERIRQNAIKVLMALAVAGWILPLLPGLPFFLGAWWLGWRPAENNESSAGKSPEKTLPPKIRNVGHVNMGGSGKTRDARI